MPFSRRSWAGWSLAFGGSLFLLILATLPAVVDEPVRAFVMWVFSGLCHQIPERSPEVGGVVLAVCHRCYGIYAALPAAALLFLAVRRWDDRISRAARWIIPLAVAVPGVDWLGDVLGFWSNTPASRLATGAVFGLAGGYFLARALTDVFAPRKT